MNNLYLIIILGNLVFLTGYIYYYKLKNKSKNPKVLFKNIHIPPIIKSTNKKEHL